MHILVEMLDSLSCGDDGAGLGDVPRLHDVFLIFLNIIASLKIEKPCTKNAKSAMFLVMFDVSEWAHTVLEILELNKKLLFE